MANSLDFKNITRARLKTVDILIKAKDWESAVYMMGYVLECALKSAICKTLNLVSYPQNTKNQNVDNYFMTHKFDQLLIPSGMEDLFSTRGPVEAFQSWSEFTKEYPGDWPAMRYNVKVSSKFDEIKVKKLYENLTQEHLGILSIMDKEKRW